MTKHKILSYAGLASAVSLGALSAFFVVGPSLTRSDASATENFGLTDISVRGVASITATDTVSMDLVPKANDSTFTTGYGEVTVTSNTTAGYYIYMSTDDSSLTYSGHETQSDVQTISTNTALGSAMAAPSWGYVVGTKCGQSDAFNCVSKKQDNAADLALTYNKVPGSSGAPLVTRGKGDPEATAKGETIYVGYGFKAAANQSVGVYSRKVTYTGLARKAAGTLLVNPNGGTWTHDGHAYTNAEPFTQDEGTEITIEAPSTNAHYAISYVNDAGASATTTGDKYTKAYRNFESWTVGATAGGDAVGAYDSGTNTYTFADGNDTATANYASTASFTLPAITKTGYSCQWAEGSATSSTKVGGSSETSRTASADTTYYAVCTQNTSGAVTFKGSNITFAPTSLTGIPSNGGSKTVTVTPAANHYFSAQPSCTGNFRTSDMTTGTSATSAQTVTIYYDGAAADATSECTFTVTSSKTYMQNWTGCSSLSGTTTLYDNRDEEAYTVTKFSDGKCWMTQNLAIAGKTLTSTDSDVSSNFPLPASATNFNSNTETKVLIDSTYGGYYNWFAATAGTGTASMSSGEASSSICPKGWKLPTSSQLSSLKTAVGAANFTKSPFNGQLAGGYDGTSRYNVGSYGSLWSSTADSSGYADSLYFDSSRAGTSNYNKANGFSVRCVSGS